jgi:hypothetical protein
MSTIDRTMKDDLKAFRIAGLPSEFYYIPNFITPEEEASILDKVNMLSSLSCHIYINHVIAFRTPN